MMDKDNDGKITKELYALQSARTDQAWPGGRGGFWEDGRRATASSRGKKKRLAFSRCSRKWPKPKRGSSKAKVLNAVDEAEGHRCWRWTAMLTTTTIYPHKTSCQESVVYDDMPFE